MALSPQSSFSTQQVIGFDAKTYNRQPNIAKLIPMKNIFNTYKRQRTVVLRTPLERSAFLSDLYGANIYLKREDMQIIRSYKLRGAYNKITSLSETQRKQGIVCCSAGNHGQAVAYVCNLLKINCSVFMPTVTTSLKIKAVKGFGKEFCNLTLVGDTFDDCNKAAEEYCIKHDMVMVHAFDDEKIIEGFGTIAPELLEDLDQNIDFIFLPCGGGGVAAGVSSYFKQVSPETIIVACQPAGAPSMKAAFQNNAPIQLEKINTFVDGAAIKKSGNRTYEILKEVLSDIALVDEGHICTIMHLLFNTEGILTEPAAALSVAGLDLFSSEIKGKNVVCLISGGNNDLGRMHDIKIFSEMYQGIRYYILVNFFMKSGAIKQFFTDCLGQDDEVIKMEYTRKNNREKGPALVGLQVKSKENFEKIKEKLNLYKITFKELKPDQELFKLLI